MLIGLTVRELCANVRFKIRKFKNEWPDGKKHKTVTEQPVNLYDHDPLVQSNI